MGDTQISGEGGHPSVICGGPASLLTAVGRYLGELRGVREGLMADPSRLLLIVLSLTCAIEFLS